MLERRIATAMSLTTASLALATTMSFADAKVGTVTASALNIRSGASTSHSIVTKAYKGNKVEILETSNGWYKVKLSNGKIGWGSGEYIVVSAISSGESTQTPSTGKKGTVTASALNIRSGASTSHSIVTKAYKGNTVEILESSNGWHKVKLSNGKIGWASGQYINISADNNTNSGNTSQESTQTPSTGKKGTVTASALNIRSGASTSHSIVTKAYKGNTVEILESSNGWHKVKLSNGKIGWASGQYINISADNNTNSGNTSQESTQTPSTGKKGTVTASALNIRSGASTSHSIVTKAYKGNTVEILESSNGWHKVKLSNGKIGWASGQYINISANNNTNSGNTSQESTQTPSTGKKGTVTASALNIRSGASTSHSIVTKAYKGNTVEILESSNGWHKVKLSNGKIGWASAQYISTSSVDNTTNGNTSQESTQAPSNNENNVSGTQSSNKVQAIVNTAKAQIGKKKAWGAEGPNAFDCSGLTYYIYKQNGITIPRTSREQSNFGTTVSKSNLQPGDLLFFSTDGSGGVSHVGIYVGNGQMVHVSSSKNSVISTSINTSYWQKAYIRAKRVL